MAVSALSSWNLLESSWVLPALVAALSVPTVLLAERVIRQEEDKDPSVVVMDEFLGQLIVFAWVPVSLPFLILGFVFFRIADIWKPFPVNRVESLPGGWGILADDLLAGLMAGGCLFALQELWELFES